LKGKRRERTGGQERERAIQHAIRDMPRIHTYSKLFAIDMPCRLQGYVFVRYVFL